MLPRGRLWSRRNPKIIQSSETSSRPSKATRLGKRKVLRVAHAVVCILEGFEVVNLAGDCGGNGEDTGSENCSKSDFAFATKAECCEYRYWEDGQEDISENVEGSTEVVEGQYIHAAPRERRAPDD